MNILFMHRHLPAQFKHLLQLFADQRTNNVFGICLEGAPALMDSDYTGVKFFTYKTRRSTTPNLHHYVLDLEKSVLNAQAVAEVLYALKASGLHLDLAFAHLGWGESLYFKEIFPSVPLIGYSEYYYHSQGADVGFDPQYPVSLDHRMKVRTLNAQVLLNFVSSDVCVTPTCWQKQLFPPEIHNKIHVIHEGVDTDLIRPNKQASLLLPNGRVLSKEDEVITYCARNLEPYRGFPIFMRAVAEICRRRPNCHVVITGSDGVSYGLPLANGLSYREQALRELDIDTNRVHFMGQVAYPLHLLILQVSTVHVYLTYPFVLSWSFMEAMASGCVIIGSRTGPVIEMLKDERNGLLVDFFDHQQIVTQIERVLDHPERMQHLADTARETILHGYTLRNSLAQYQYLYNSLLTSSN